MRKLIGLLWLLVYIAAAPLQAADDTVNQTDTTKQTNTGNSSDEAAKSNKPKQEKNKTEKAAETTTPKKGETPSANTKAAAQAKPSNGNAENAEKKAASTTQASKNATPQQPAPKADEKKSVIGGKEVEKGKSAEKEKKAENKKPSETTASKEKEDAKITEKGEEAPVKEPKQQEKEESAELPKQHKGKSAPLPARAATAEKVKPTEHEEPVEAEAPEKKETAKITEKKEEAQAAPPAVAVPKQKIAPVEEKPTPAEKQQKQEPVKEKAHPSYYNPEEAKIEAVDIDTIDLFEPKGNWLLKRQWWEAAELAYEQIKKVVDQIFDARLTVYNERTELDRTVFNNFFHSVGMGQGELQEIVETLTQEIDKNVEEKGSLSKTERDIMSRIRDEKDRLKKLYDTIEHINEIEKALNAALITMREQIEAARENERKAWKNFKDIARELSDHKAYELYYAMNSFMTNVSEIYKYLHGPFADYYRQLGERAKKDVKEVSESMKALKEKGIDLKQQAEEFIHKQKCVCPEAEKEEEEGEEEATGFFGTLWYYVKAPFVFIGSAFADAYDGVRSLFVSAPVDEEEETQE